MRKLSLLLFLSIVGIVVFGQKEDSAFIKRISDEILVNGKAYENLRHLTKKIGARLAGSQGMVKSEHWGLKVMQESGADKAYMQECMVPHWVRGGEDRASLKKKPSGAIDWIRKDLDIVALGNSIGSEKNGISGEVIEVKSFDDLEKRKDEVKGKIVFYNYKFNDTYINTFLAYRDASQYRGQGPSRAAKYGAKAVIVRSMSHATDNNPHTGATRYDSNYAKIPAVAIGLRDADWLSTEINAQAETTKPAQLELELFTHGHFLPDTIGHNIIGELKGTQFPAEIITVGGHLDSWDNCEGAHDDGAGCVQTIEILRAFKALGYQPKRTIRFVLFANEENGLRGGNKYADEAKAKGEKHIFALESDAGGFTPRSFGMTGTEEQFQKFLSWKPLIAPYGCTEFNRGGGGADIGPLNRAFKTPTAGLNPDSQRYFDIHHARNDVFEAVNKRELDLGAVNMAALIYLVDKYGM
ncbi:peptidase M28 family protein [Chitinophagaceae bacterium IBVUCB2]|nr:peptidase M28 family protein [Chitinophagaceae bacterium IBVUCB2]